MIDIYWMICAFREDLKYTQQVLCEGIHNVNQDTYSSKKRPFSKIRPR